MKEAFQEKLGIGSSDNVEGGDEGGETLDSQETPRSSMDDQAKELQAKEEEDK